jgi:hypothetical protein
VPKRTNDRLNPALVARLCRAIRKHPSLTDAADACGVHPRTLQLWIKQGLYPNPDPGCHALAVAARRSRALLRGKLFERLVAAATDKNGDPKWAAYLLERLDEEGEITWQSTVPSPGENALVRRELFQNPPPALLEDIAAAGMKLVPLEPGDELPALVEGELVDDE